MFPALFRFAFLFAFLRVLGGRYFPFRGPEYLNGKPGARQNAPRAVCAHLFRFRLVRPRRLTVAKAYVNQLERAQALPADRIAELRQAIQKAEASKLRKGDAGKLKNRAATADD